MRRAAVTASLFVAAGTLLVLNQQTSAAGPGSPVEACVAEYGNGPAALARGQVKKTDPNGQVIAVGGKGTTITVNESTAQSMDASVSASDDSDTEALAKAYAAQGRSVLQDARAAGVAKGLVRDLCEDALADGERKVVAAGDGTITDSLCVHDAVDYVEWDGCVTRYTVSDNDANWNYGLDDAQAHGHETACCYWNDLHAGGIKNQYASSYADIVKASPGSDITDVNSCYTQSFGLTIAGFGASSGGTVCPSRWNITWPGQTTGTESHKTQWEGETNSDREALSMVGFRRTPGHSSNYSLVINWDVH